jgi:opacity protein-like surface antigen
MKRIAITLVSLAGLLAWCAVASAQPYRLAGFGAKAGYVEPENLDGAPMIGGHLEFERNGSHVHILPSVMYWNVNDVRNVNPNVDAYYHFESEGSVSPYLGAGLGMNFLNDRRSDTTNNNLGMNLFGGVRFPAATSHGFVEARVTAADRSQFALLGGMTFNGR